jgi:hypothetical protein
VAEITVSGGAAAGAGRWRAAPRRATTAFETDPDSRAPESLGGGSGALAVVDPSEPVYEALGLLLAYPE